MTASFSAPELAGEAGVPLERVEWLIKLGILKADGGRFGTGDAFRVKMIQALLEAGFTPAQVEGAVAEGLLNLDHVDAYVPAELNVPSGHTFADFAAQAGDRGAILPSIYRSLGLPEPDPEARVPTHEEELLRDFLRTWQLAREDETLIRAARLIGEGTRMAAVGWPDLFGEQVARPARERLLSREIDRFPDEVIRSGTLLVRLVPGLMAWLTQRYMEQRIIEGIVDNFEEFLASRGLAAPPERTAPAIVFVDLSGYTRLTEERGDEAAVRAAAALQRRAEVVARDRDGRLVKLLGDGAMLHFREAGPAVRAAMDLVSAIREDLGLEARAGVAAGPVIERDRDLFGRTVNLASRIAGKADPGEVLVSASVARAVEGDGLVCDPLGRAELKGIPEPVPVFRVVAGGEL